MDLFVILFICSMFNFPCGGKRHEHCDSQQHLELGTTGTIRCSFEEGFFGVFWYDSSDVGEKAIITLKDTVKNGDGYLSGEFDIQSDGSLIINNVSMRHDKVFTVVLFNSTLQDPVDFSIRVIVYVNPFPRYLVIHDCENQQNCVLEKQREDVITCSVYSIRPEVKLEWHILHGREELPHFFSNHNLTVTKDEDTFNTFDISLTSMFQSPVEYKKRMTIECKVSEPMTLLFPMSSQVVLSFTEDNSDDGTRESRDVLLIVLLTGGIFLLLCLLLLFIFIRGLRKNSSRANAKNKQELDDVRKTVEDSSSEKLPLTTEINRYIPEDVEYELDDQEKVLRYWKRKFEDIAKRYVLKDSVFDSNKEKDSIVIAILGKNGVGKSATANTILGDKVFPENRTNMPFISVSNDRSVNIQGRCVTVVDTPGFLDPLYPAEMYLQAVSELCKSCSSGIDVFVIVINIGSSDFNDKDVEAMKSFENAVGGNLKNYLALVCSHADSMIKGNLDQYLEKQNRSESFSIFLDSFGKNIVGVNNASTVLAEKERNQEVIIAMADSMKARNKHALKFTNKLLLKKSNEYQNTGKDHVEPTQEMPRVVKMSATDLQNEVMEICAEYDNMFDSVQESLLSL